MESVESCLKLIYPHFRILIVDNGSTDGSVSRLHERLPNIDILQTGKNLGFAGGNNAGILHALSQGANYIWLLNNDTTVDPAALSELVHVLQLDNKIGIVGSKIYYYDQPDVIWFAGGWLRNWSGTGGNIGQLKADDERYNKLTEVDFITGCSLLIKSEVLSKVGLMDERFFLIYEDADWNQRVREQGYKILYVPSSRVWHKASASIGSDSPDSYYYNFRNSLLFTLKHRIIYLPTATLKRFQDIIYLLFHRKFSAAKAAINGLRDFFLFRFGQMNSRSR